MRRRIFSLVGKVCHGFTLVELMVAVVIMVFIFSSANAIYNNYFSAFRRLSVMTYSNQELERLRGAMNKDLRAALQFEIAPDGRSIKMTCALDEANILGGSFGSGGDISRETNTSMGDTSLVPLLEGASPDLYYEVEYEYRERPSFTYHAASGWLEESNPMVTVHPRGIMEVREGIIIRKGPLPAMDVSAVTDQSLNAWTSGTQLATVVTAGWNDRGVTNPAAGPIFDYWPNSGDRDSARGINITLWRRDTYATKSKRYDYMQEFTTTLSSRTLR